MEHGGSPQKRVCHAEIDEWLVASGELLKESGIEIEPIEEHTQGLDQAEVDAIFASEN